MLSHVQFFANSMDCSQAPLPMGFSRQEYWRGLPFPPPGSLPNPGIEPTSAWQAHSLPLSRQGGPVPFNISSQMPYSCRKNTEATSEDPAQILEPACPQTSQRNEQASRAPPPRAAERARLAGPTPHGAPSTRGAPGSSAPVCSCRWRRQEESLHRSSWGPPAGPACARWQREPACFISRLFISLHRTRIPELVFKSIESKGQPGLFIHSWASLNHCLTQPPFPSRFLFSC